eukprot:6211916-Pleurochrysis_carterae.AAC.3
MTATALAYRDAYGMGSSTMFTKKTHDAVREGADMTGRRWDSAASAVTELHVPFSQCCEMCMRAARAKQTNSVKIRQGFSLREIYTKSLDIIRRPTTLPNTDYYMSRKLATAQVLSLKLRLFCRPKVILEGGTIFSLGIGTWTAKKIWPFFGTANLIRGVLGRREISRIVEKLKSVGEPTPNKVLEKESWSYST